MINFSTTNEKNKFLKDEEFCRQVVRKVCEETGVELSLLMRMEQGRTGKRRVSKVRRILMVYFLSHHWFESEAAIERFFNMKHQSMFMAKEYELQVRNAPYFDKEYVKLKIIIEKILKEITLNVDK